MAFTRSFRDTVLDRAKTDPDFRMALVEEAFQAVLDGDLPEARIMLRDCINATVGFEKLGAETNLPVKSLMRMVGPNGNPTAGNLFSILRILQESVQAKPCVTLDRVA